jgi:hypothetical protein
MRPVRAPTLVFTARCRYSAPMFRIFGLALLCALLCAYGTPLVVSADEQTNATLQTDTSQAGMPTNAATDGRGPFDGALSLSPGFKIVPGLDIAKPSGKLTIHLPDGTVYEGEVRDGKPNGQGTLTNQRGSNEYGEWRNGIEYRVSGTIVFSDGTKEVGTWNNDGSASAGTIVWPDGRQYKGHWRFVQGQPDIPSGQGEMTWPDGRKYTGQFSNGTMDGPGKMTYPDGKVEDGAWKAGKFTSATP